MNNGSALVVICRHAQSIENLYHPIHTFPARGQTRWRSAFLFRLSSCVLFEVHLVPRFSQFCTFLLMISSFKMAPKCNAEALASS